MKIGSRFMPEAFGKLGCWSTPKGLRDGLLSGFKNSEDLLGTVLDV